MLVPVLAMTCSIVLGLNALCPEPSNSWLPEFRSALADLRTAYEEWTDTQQRMSEGRDNTDKALFEMKIQAEAMVAELRLMDDLWKLWRTSGRCEFGDTSPDMLPHRTPLIASRYERFAEMHGSIPFPSLRKEQIEHNIEMLRTPYALGAIAQIQMLVAFRPAIGSTAWKVQGEVLPVDERAVLYSSMKEWLKKNHGLLRWDPSVQKFARVGLPSSFEVPKPVVALLTRILSVDACATGPSKQDQGYE